MQGKFDLDSLEFSNGRISETKRDFLDPLVPKFSSSLAPLKILRHIYIICVSEEYVFTFNLTSTLEAPTSPLKLATNNKNDQKNAKNA